MNRLRLALLALALCCTAPPGAEAQRAPGLERARREARAAEAARREVPDYDGRGPEPTTAGEVALWIPRAVLSPLYVVSEFVVRRPLGWLLSKAEREQWAATLFALFQFGPNREIAIVPTGLVDFGFRPSVGVYARWNDFLVPHNKLRLYAATGGGNWGKVSLAERVDSEDQRRQVQLRADYTHRPDALFYGIAQDSSGDNESRYAFTRMELELSFAQRAWRSSSARAFAHLRRLRFGGATCCGEPSIERRVADGSLRAADGSALGLPPGYDDGYTLYGHGIEVFLDTREERPAPGSGVRLGIRGEYGVETESGRDVRLFRYGVAPSVHFDVTGQNRVLELGLNVQQLVLTRGQPAFSELIDLSDDGPLKGFVPGQIVGPSAVALTLEYHWPIWVWLDGTIHVAAGNAFGTDFDGLALGAMRLSTGIGIRAPMERDHAFNFLVAIGTKSFRDGAEIESFRLVLGATREF